MPGPDSYAVFVPHGASRLAEIQQIAMLPARVDHNHLVIDCDSIELMRLTVDRLRLERIDCRPMVAPT